MRIRPLEDFLCDGDLYWVFYEESTSLGYSTRRSPFKGLLSRDLRGSSMRRKFLEGLQAKETFRMSSEGNLFNVFDSETRLEKYILKVLNAQKAFLNC